MVTYFLSLAARIGANPADADDTRIEKTVFVISSLMVSVAGIIWGLTYFAFGETLAGVIPISYSLISLANLVAFALMRQYSVFRFTQLTLILLLPFLLMIALGGFVNSSAVILWSLLAPIGTLVFGDTRQALRWFLAYLALIIFSGFLQPYLRSVNNLPPLVVLAFFVMNIGAVSFVAFVLLDYFIKQLELERAKSENLLMNMLPRDVAARLKNSNRIIADLYPATSILFADIVQFTPLSASMTPEQVATLLNEIFSQFDELAERCGCEKVETIGDSYMVAAGVPTARTDHAQSLVRLAFAMRDYIAARPAFEGKRVDFRYGINSGPVTAGVIGRKKIAFHLWGDTVNTASRMQSTGEAGKIHISQTAYDLICNDFICEPRGRMEVKGKGEMQTWFVVGAK